MPDTFISFAQWPIYIIIKCTHSKMQKVKTCSVPIGCIKGLVWQIISVSNINCLSRTSSRCANTFGWEAACIFLRSSTRSWGSRAAGWVRLNHPLFPSGKGNWTVRKAALDLRHSEPGNCSATAPPHLDMSERRQRPELGQLQMEMAKTSGLQEWSHQEVHSTGSQHTSSASYHLLISLFKLLWPAPTSQGNTMRCKLHTVDANDFQAVILQPGRQSSSLLNIQLHQNQTLLARCVCTYKEYEIIYAKRSNCSIIQSAPSNLLIHPGAKT